MITLWILWLSYKIEPGSQDSDEPRTGGPRYPGTSDPNRKPITCLCGQVPLLQFSTILICKDLSKILFPGATFIHRPWADSGKLGVKKISSMRISKHCKRKRTCCQPLCPPAEPCALHAARDGGEENVHGGRMPRVLWDHRILLQGPMGMGLNLWSWFSKSRFYLISFCFAAHFYEHLFRWSRGTTPTWPRNSGARYNHY